METSNTVNLSAIRERLGRKQMDGSNQCAWHQGQHGVECKVCDGLVLLAALDGAIATIERLTAALDAVRKCPAFMCDPCEKCAALLASVADPRGVRGVDWDQNDSPAETAP